MRRRRDAPTESRSSPDDRVGCARGAPCGGDLFREQDTLPGRARVERGHALPGPTRRRSSPSARTEITSGMRSRSATGSAGPPLCASTGPVTARLAGSCRPTSGARSAGDHVYEWAPPARPAPASYVLRLWTSRASATVVVHVQGIDVGAARAAYHPGDTARLSVRTDARHLTRRRPRDHGRRPDDAP